MRKEWVALMKSDARCDWHTNPTGTPQYKPVILAEEQDVNNEPIILDGIESDIKQNEDGNT